MKKYKFTIRGNEYEVELKDFEENTAKIEVNGTVYEVEVHREKPVQKTPTLVRSEMPAPRRGDTKIKKNIGKTAFAMKAPLPGNIMQVMVKAGDQVKKGDALLIYEAMKMENKMLAEKDGIISNVKVNPGDSVLQGDVLLEMDI